MGNACDTLNGPGQSLDPAQIQLQKNEDHVKVNDKKYQINSQKNQEQLYSQQRNKFVLSPETKQKKNLPRNHSDFRKTIQQQYQLCQQAYKQHYIDQAAQFIDKIQLLIDQANKNRPIYDLSEEERKLMEKIKTQYEDVVFYQNQIEKGGWDLKSDKNGIKISCRRQPDGTVGCRIQALSDVPFQILISVMIQIDYYKDYTPFTEISREEKEVSRNCRIGYTLNHLPFFTKRQSFFQGVGYSRLSDKSKQLFLYTRSIHDKKHLQEMLDFTANINEEYVQLDYKYFVVRYRPIKKNIGIIDIAMNVDAKMGFIPTWLMEKVSQDFGQKFFKNIVRISKNFKGSKWEKNVQKNPHLFLYFQKQVRDYLQKHKLS